MLLLVVAVACCFLVSHTSAQCPTGCACTRGDQRILCTAVGFTEIPVFPDSIRQSATTLDLTGNSITSIRATDLQNFTRLETLDLSANLITSIEAGSFSSNTALENLDLSTNMLREIPDNLFEPTVLFSLDLSSNNIANVSASTFAGVQQDSTIRLDNNVIRTLPEDTFDNVGRIDELSMSGNPFRCDCELRWFPAFKNSIRARSMLGTCDVPASLNGVDLDTLTEEQFECECTPSCVNGTCNTTVGLCECDDGFLGSICDTPCPTGSFGPGCSQNCSCIPEQESSPCDNVNGTCHCLPGYTGDLCEEECPDGFYGQDCLDVCQCENGECNFITGFCNCSAGFVGVACNMTCLTLRFGLGCSEVCNCSASGCDHITGECSCTEGYFGTNCDHNCTEATNCSTIGRMECSLQTPEQTCGPCLQGHVGEEGDSNSICTLCSGAPNCTALNREPCSNVVNTCGHCIRRHIPQPEDNQTCFDPCVDGVMNYNETDIDCGGPLCPPCHLNQTCTGPMDCGIDAVCLGYYRHPSGLSFPFDVLANNTCVNDTDPGNAIAQRFINALRGRDNPLPDIEQNPDFTLDDLEESVEREMLAQFNIPEPLESIAITDLEQAPGSPLYQTDFKLSEGTEEDGFDTIVESIHAGKLQGTVLFNQRDRRALHNL